MPFVSTASGNLHYAVTGQPSSPALVLSNSLGTNFSMWDPQLPAFKQHFRVIRYDTRGHGQSAVPAGPYTIEQLGADVLALLDELRIARAHFCGLSMGGMTGMWLAQHAPQRLHKLVISSASARFGSVETWNARIEKVRSEGMSSVATAVVERWYTLEFRREHTAQTQGTLQILEATSPEGYAACCAALRDSDLRESISGIHTPTLILSGAKDPVSPPADGRYLAAKIAGARYRELDAAHLSNIEAAEAYTSAVLNFLTSEGA
jgi:3-oxoadipate enol-lactonase